MAIDELTDEMTHEEVQALAKKLVSEPDINDEPEPEPEKSGPPTHETPAGSAGDEPAPAKGDEPAPVEPSGWIDDDVRGLVSAFGLTEEDVSLFTGRDELERALTLLDSRARKHVDAELGRETQPPPPQATAHPAHPDRRADGTFLPADQRRAAQEAVQEDFRLQLDPELHGQDLVEQLGKLQEHYGARIKTLADRLAAQERVEQERAEQAFVQVFDATVDSLGQTDLFGQTGKETREQMANRVRLFEEFQVRQAIHGRQGRQVSLNKPFLDYISRAAFAEHFFKQQHKQLTQRVMAQAGKRMDVGVTKTAAARPSLEERMEQRYRELDQQR